MGYNKYTFWQLISEKRIVIPIIQRDYAQGREGKEYVRKGFLEQLGNAIFKKRSIGNLILSMAQKMIKDYVSA